jgi:trehalose 2-sulfotransferase
MWAKYSGVEHCQDSIDLDDAYAAWVLRPTLPLVAVEPQLAWFLCGVQRSGTWLLAGLLDSTGIAGRPHEWFSEATEAENRRMWRVSATEDYSDYVRRAGTTPNGVFACMLKWNALERAGDLTALAPERRFVWLRREPEAIGVSWAWAAQTGRYHAWDPPPQLEPRFVREEVDALVGLAREHDAAWACWFADHADVPLELWFDEVVADPGGASTHVLAHLGLPNVPAVVRTEPAPPSDWRARYMR